MKKITTIIIAAATIATAQAEPDQHIAMGLQNAEKVKFLASRRSAIDAPSGFPWKLQYWREAELSYAVDPADEMIGSPSAEIVEQARQAFDRHISEDSKRKVKLWCLDFYEAASRHMARTGEEINDDALPGFLEKAAAKVFPNDPLMQRWFSRYASMELDVIAEKWEQIKGEELFASNAVNAFANWRKQLRKKLTAVKVATQTKL